MKLEAVRCTNNGKPAWKVEIPASAIGARKRIFGTTKESALAKAQAEIDEHVEFGSKLRDLTVPERIFMITWRDKFTLEEMEDALKSLSALNEKTMTLAEGISLFIATKAGLKREHIRDLTWRLRHFEETFPGRTVASIKPGELDTLLREKKGSGPNFYRVLRAFFNHSVLHEWRIDNPFDKVPPPVGDPAIKEVWTPDAMSKALRCATGIDGHPKRIPALMLFILSGLSGLRYSEARLRRWEDFDPATNELHIGNMKTAKRGMRERWITLLPVARAWLEWVGIRKEGIMIEINDKNLRVQRDAILEATKLGDWPHNGLRRSFASYHLKAFEPGKTAPYLGHTDAATTLGKYNVARREADAAAWFALTPETVLAKKKSAAETEVPAADAEETKQINGHVKAAQSES